MAALNYSRMQRNLKGYLAEKKVRNTIQQFERTGARVHHDLSGVGYNIDHVMIDSHGVFVVETKFIRKRSRRAKLICRDDRVFMEKTPLRGHMIGQASRAALTVKRLLEKNGVSVPVKAIVVAPGWYIEGQPTSKHVWVLNEKGIPKCIEREAPNLSADSVRDIYSILRDHDVRETRRQAA